MKKVKNFVAGILIAATMAAMVSGCSTKKSEMKSTEESMAVSNQTVNTDGNIVTEVKERGLRFTISQEYIDKGVEVEPYNENTKGYPMATISYYSPTSKQLLNKLLDMNPEEVTHEVADQYTQDIWATTRTLMEIAMVETDEYERLIASGKVPEDFTFHTPAEQLGTNGAYTYIISIPELDYGNLNAAEQQDYEECKAYMQTVKESLSFIPIELENNETAIGTTVPSFKSEDLNGNIVTNDIFLQKDLTVVNAWGTFCGPCIEEMPELAEWSKAMPDNVQMIGLVGDIEGKEDTKHFELAKKIVEKAGADFVNIIPNEDFKELLSGIVGYPTTFFVDKEGNIVGDPIVGADVDGYKAFVEAYLGK